MQTIIDKYYDPRIQTNKIIIADIAKEIYGKNKKMLVFGLGYDSNLWYNLTNGNTFFVEDKKEYIEMNTAINNENIIQCSYEGITVKSSLNMTDNILSSFIIPKKIIENAPYDIIYIDGPCGYNENTPGRLLPIFWSKTFLSKTGTIIYIDDYNRPLEKLSVNNYFNDYKNTIFNERAGCIKIIY
jgi:hypothetical protein